MGKLISPFGTNPLENIPDSNSELKEEGLEKNKPEKKQPNNSTSGVVQLPEKQESIKRGDWKEGTKPPLTAFNTVLSAIERKKMGLTPDKIDLIKKMMASEPRTSFSKTTAIDALENYTKEDLASLINNTSVAVIKAKPSFFISAFKKLKNLSEG